MSAGSVSTPGLARRPHAGSGWGNLLIRCPVTSSWRACVTGDQRPGNAPELTALKRQFLAAAEEAEAARTNAERRQLEEMRAAQEAREQGLLRMDAEQKARAKAQRRNRWFVSAAALLAFALFAGATWQSRETVRREALVMTSAGDKAIKEGLYERAIRIAVQGLPRAGALPPFSLGWEALEVRGLEAKLAGAAEASALRLVLQGHTDTVVSASFSPDGARIVTASSDRTARLWDAEWLAALHGAELVHRACEEKLVPGVKLFTPEDAADPILFGLAGTTPCERSGPLSLRYWTRLRGS
jgi:hypothetical protein